MSGGESPEIRYCPIVPGRASIISTARGRRPKILRATDVEAASKTPINCPFCPGNEFMTPPATLTLRRVGGNLIFDWESEEERYNDWVVRVVPNKYPALTPYATGPKAAYGYHEVIIENRRHDGQPPRVSAEELALTFKTAFRRVAEILKSDSRIKYVIIIRNYGARGGASIPHPHMQVFASEVVMPLIDEELKAFEDARVRELECPLCKEVEAAEREGRIVFRGWGYVAFTAYAPRQPYETWLVPLKHSDNPLTLEGNALLNFTKAFKKLLTIFTERLGDPAYNLWIHLPPRRSLGSGVFHWHLELSPVIATWGGLEKGGRTYIVTVPPERAAAELRGEVEGAVPHH